MGIGRKVVINVVTFTALFLVGLVVSRLLFKYSFVFPLVWRWIMMWAGRAVGLVWRVR